MAGAERAGEGIWGRWQVVAHRCGGALAPENSLAGLRMAAGKRLATVEFDVMLSADGVPMLIHDETLDRTTAAHGPVAARTAAELAAMANNAGWGCCFSGERIPTLSEALADCLRLGLVPNIEVKPAAGFERATGIATAHVAATAWAGSGGDLPLLSSFSEVALVAAREVLVHWPAALLVEEVPPDWRDRMRQSGVASLHCRRRQASWDWLAEASAAGVAVRCYTVNDPDEAIRLRERGVVGVFSDRIDRVR